MILAFAPVHVLRGDGRGWKGLAEAGPVNAHERAHGKALRAPSLPRPPPLSPQAEKRRFAPMRLHCLRITPRLRPSSSTRLSFGAPPRAAAASPMGSDTMFLGPPTLPLRSSALHGLFARAEELRRCLGANLLCRPSNRVSRRRKPFLLQNLPISCRLPFEALPFALAICGLVCSWLSAHARLAPRQSALGGGGQRGFDSDLLAAERAEHTRALDSLSFD